MTPAIFFKARSIRHPQAAAHWQASILTVTVTVTVTVPVISGSDSLAVQASSSYSLPDTEAKAQHSSSRLQLRCCSSCQPIKKYCENVVLNS
jgi:hypothetical protein